MLLRRTTSAALALAALVACEPNVPYSAANNPGTVDYAAFDPNGDAARNIAPLIPLPNDLALQDRAVASVPAGAYHDLVASFAAQQGFPADLEVPITLDFVRENVGTTGLGTRTAPPLDVTSINASNFIALQISSTGIAPIALDPITPASYQTVGDHGELTLRKAPDANGNRYWTSGARYIVAMRGGPSGVKVTGGSVLNPQPAMFLLTQVPTGKTLLSPEYLGLIPGGSYEEKQATANDLETLRTQYAPAFALIDSRFPHTEIATMTTFGIVSGVRIDLDPKREKANPTAGQPPLPDPRVPFPSDFLLDPATHHLIPAAQAQFDALAPGLGSQGLVTLDGFSTTAAITVNTTGLIDATTVTAGSVFLYELGATPKRIPGVGEASPGWAPVSSQLVLPGTTTTNVIAIQPAIPVQTPTAFFSLPPLNEGKEYAVIVTDAVTEPGGAKIKQATLGRLLAATGPLVQAGVPTVPGLAAADAAQIEPLRAAMAPALDDLKTAKGIGRERVVVAYTFRTQTFKSAATSLAALPYSLSSDPNNAGSLLQPAGASSFYCGNATACTAGTVASVMTKYGVDTTLLPTGSIDTVVESSLFTLNNLGPTGAFNDPTKTAPTPEAIPVLISLPALPASCTTPPCSIPLVVWRHGLGGSRASIFLVASQLNAAGYAVAAIDANKHGNRSFCNPARNGAGGANPECTAAGTCNEVVTGQQDPTGQGPGTCSTAFQNQPVLCNSTATCNGFFAANAGTPAASGEYLVTLNMFRTRDSLRQDIIDQSQLLRVLSPDPRPTTGSAPNTFFTAQTGLQVDKTKVYFLGQSLGSISGAVDLASNPRFAKAALNVGGGTIVDVFSQSPNLQGNLNTLLSGLGIAPGTPQYSQFLVVAKWILDPADPINYSLHLTGNTLTSPLLAGAQQPPKAILAQTAACDQTVPTGFQFLLAGDTGLSPVPFANPPLANATHQYFVRPTLAPTTGQLGSPGCATASGVVNHGFLTDWVTYGQVSPSITLTAQNDVAAFFAGTQPPSTRVAP